jgi:caa(3)-type oxidase subunit IV
VAEKNKQDDGQHAHEHGAGRYVVIWLALLAFTITTVVTGRMDLGGANLPLALIIATIKATLVVMFFMGVFGDLLTRLPDALPTGRHAHTLEGGDLPSAPSARPHAE